MIVWLRHFLGWVASALRSRKDLILENLSLRQQTARCPCQLTPPATHGVAQAPLGYGAQALESLERSPHGSYAENGCDLSTKLLWVSEVDVSYGKNDVVHHTCDKRLRSDQRERVLKLLEAGHGRHEI